MSNTVPNNQESFAAALTEMLSGGYDVEFYRNADPDIEGTCRVRISRDGPSAYAWGHGASPAGALAYALDAYMIRGPEGSAIENFLASIDPMAELDQAVAESEPESEGS